MAPPSKTPITRPVSNKRYGSMTTECRAVASRQALRAKRLKIDAPLERFEKRPVNPLTLLLSARKFRDYVRTGGSLRSRGRSTGGDYPPDGRAVSQSKTSGAAR